MRRISDLIKERGFTHAQVAEAIGTSPKSLPNLIAPNRNITVNTLRKIANAIGCSITDFFTDEAQPSGTQTAADGAVPIITCPHCGHQVKVCVKVEQTDNTQ